MFDTMVSIRCFRCTMRFDVSQEWQEARIQDRVTFYCPIGHPQNYIGKTNAEKLAEKESELARVKAELYAARDDKEKAYAKLDRQAKRIHAGVCPKCNRTFDNVARHMKSKHLSPK